MHNKYLITSALPYVNGPLHIGHLIGCLLPSDIYARYCRARGRNVLYVCGADEHGTPSVVGAMKQGLSVEEYNEGFYQNQLQAVQNFKLSFDLYGRTHTQKQTELVQSLFKRWDELGLIEERTMRQPFSVTDNMFLSDRQIEGTCPKCGYERANGDQCEKCGSLLDPSDLIHPYSIVSHSHDIEFRETKHLYFLYSKLEDQLRDWVNSRQGWPKTAMSIAHKWLSEGLKDTPITRDLSWGIPVNKPGYENKVFYVWFDAPWGYVSISEYANDNWADWWKQDDTFYAQFMGKDNVSFHSVFFPSQELALQDNWKTVDLLKAFNFMNFEGNKISKSKGNGVFLDTAIDYAPSDAWRYALTASAPETDDSDFTVQRFADIVNKDLNGMLGNFVSRVTKLTEKNFGLNVPAKQDCAACEFIKLENALNTNLAKLTDAIESCEFRDAIFALRSLWAAGNEFMTEMEPWALVKNGDMVRAGAVLNECFQLIDFYARVSAPFIPDAADKMRQVFAQTHDKTWPTQYERRIANGADFIVPENLFNRFDDAMIAAMTEKYSAKKTVVPTIVVAKITSVKPHPEKEGLSILTVDAGEENDLQIVCGAPNVRVGFVGVLAKVGAKLPGAKKPITKRSVANIESNGMMVSPAEIGAGDDADNILELDANAIIGSEYKNG